MREYCQSSNWHALSFGITLLINLRSARSFSTEHHSGNEGATQTSYILYIILSFTGPWVYDTNQLQVKACKPRPSSQNTIII